MDQTQSANDLLYILSLEDSRADFEIIRELLVDAGYDLHMDRVETEKEFIAALNSRKHDIILADFKLPGFNAFGALQWAVSICPDVPFICVSGSIGEETAIELIKMGAVDYVLKDRPDRLPFAVRRAINEANEKAARKQAEEKYRAIFDNASVGIIQITPEGRYLSVNPALARIHGFESPEEMINAIADAAHQLYVDPDQRTEFRRVIEEKGSVENYEIKMYRNDGSIHWVSNNTRVVRDQSGKTLYYEGIVQDITKRKQAEEELELVQLQQRALLDNNPDIAWLKDRERRFIAVNEPFADACGYEPEGLVGKTDFDIWPHDLAERYRADDKEVMDSGKRKLVEEKMIDKNGAMKWIETIKTPFYDERGNIMGATGIARDITARKLAEDELKTALEKLRKTLAGTIQAASLIVETRDPYTAGHQKRVSVLARSIAQEMKLSADTVENIRIAATLHDIGKISVPAEILSKPTKLTAIEFSLVRVHARSGYDILKEVELPYPIAQIVLQHHERMDGSGYPNGLKKEQILLEARILAVADVVEAMASHRPYRPAIGIDTALEEIEMNKGTLFDGEAVKACLKLFREKGFGFE